jgi:DNA-binding MarR family transcriptional regulator
VDQDARAAFVERFARMYEQDTSASRITGRIYAHMATADEPYLSLQQLADQLGVSRGSVSMNTRNLIALNLIERVPVPGARGEHYGVTAVGVEEVFADVVARALALADLVDEGIALQGERDTPGTRGLRAMSDTYRALAATFRTFVANRPRKEP